MKTLTINGVPYLINETDVFIYSSVPPIRIGKYDQNTLTLEEAWEKKAADWLSYYRNGLKENTKIALEKAKELQKAT